MNYFIEASNLYTTTQVDNNLPVGTVVKHYKGGTYTIVGSAKHTETEDELVLYVNTGDASKVWARPYSMFFDDVEVEGKIQKRFEVVKHE